jgi:ribose/xylose/arabinose/galactoside ABC-type transport system permease subunit
MLVWGVMVLVVLVPALVLSEGFDQHWAMVVAGAVLGVAVAVMSRRWGRAYAAQLRSEL